MGTTRDPNAACINATRTSSSSAELATPPSDSPGRSFAKAITWRAVALTITASVAYALTGSVQFAVSVGVVDSIVKIVAYYAHERAWVSWARVRQPLEVAR